MLLCYNNVNGEENFLVIAERGKISERSKERLINEFFFNVILFFWNSNKTNFIKIKCENKRSTRSPRTRTRKQSYKAEVTEIARQWAGKSGMQRRIQTNSIHVNHVFLLCYFGSYHKGKSLCVCVWLGL